jgi:GntR family transcriptional regulator
MRTPSRGFIREGPAYTCQDNNTSPQAQLELVMLAPVTKTSVHSSAHASRRENRIVPLYHQVEQVIRHRIATRQYASGLQIPSEHELGRELKVSRVTIREALRELVRENLLVKVQGKGTFVAPDLPKVLQTIKYNGFLEDLYQRVEQLKVVTVEMGRAPVTEKVRSVLNLPAAVTEIVQIKRCRHIDGEPFSFTVNYLPADIGARVDAAVLRTVPLNTVLERDLKIPIVRAEETVEAASANPEVAQHLDIPVLYPAMHVTRVMFTERDRAFEVVETFYRADKYHYSVNLSRVKRNGKWTWRHEARKSRRNRRTN